MDRERPPRGHSCRRCKERKIKCDGRQPCAACSRAGVTCSARPPATPRRARRKVQSASLSKERRTQSTNLDATDEYLINDDEGHPRYVNHPLWEDLLKELPSRASSEFTTEHTVASSSATGIVWGVSGYISLRQFHPSAVQIFQLWQIFLDNVQPLSRIIHVPSIQKEISTITANLDQIPRGLEALMFSIYLAAVNSLSESECQLILKENKTIMQQIFAKATQQALANAECLKSCSLVVLQSLTLYLLSMQQHHDHQSAWLLTGLAVRSGQRMGLHKNTITQNIRPFESELRLRLWWQIILLDCKAAKLSGFAMDIKTDNHFSSQLPLNINDADLYHEMTELPTEISTHATEMALCLVIYECASFITKFPSLVIIDGCEDANVHRRSTQVINDFVDRLRNKFLRFCNEANSFQLLTTLLAKVFTSQIRIRALQALQRQQKITTASGENSHRMSAQDGEKLLTWHTEVIETMNMIYDTSALEQYVWFAHSLFPYESLVYILKVLQTRVEGDPVDRAWRGVDTILNTFAGTNWLPCGNPNDGMYAAMGKLSIKAWRARMATRLHEEGLGFQWVDILSQKLGMNKQPNDITQAGNVAGLAISEDGNPVDHLFPAGEAGDEQSMGIDWDYWTEFMGPV